MHLCNAETKRSREANTKVYQLSLALQYQWPMKLDSQCRFRLRLDRCVLLMGSFTRAGANILLLVIATNSSDICLKDIRTYPFSRQLHLHLRPLCRLTDRWREVLQTEKRCRCWHHPKGQAYWTSELREQATELNCKYLMPDLMSCRVRMLLFCRNGGQPPKLFVDVSNSRSYLEPRCSVCCPAIRPAKETLSHGYFSSRDCGPRTQQAMKATETTQR